MLANLETAEEAINMLAVAFGVRLDVWDSPPAMVLTAGTGDGLAPLDKAGILRGRWDVERRR